MSPDANVNTGNFECDFPLIGRFNTQNMLVAASICKQLGLDDNTIKQGLKTTSQVDGRMQVVSVEGANNCNYPKVVVDYAHTPDALKNAASTLAEVAETQGGKLITVFGCGGNRDKTKRPQMAEQATLISDITVITTDNPRDEKPEEIIDDIVQGVQSDSQTEIVVDRSEAIKRAIEIASKNDIILIAGKGHEDYQEVKGVKHHFDDREIAANHLRVQLNCK